MEIKKKLKTYEATTFNMNIKLKTKAKVYLARSNQQEQDKSKKQNFGKLLNNALEFYLSDVKVEGLD